MKRKNPQKPGKQTRKPRRVYVPDNPPPEPVELWRVGSFFVFHDPTSLSSMIVDLDEQTFIRHGGDIETVFAMLEALQRVRVGGEWLYSPDDFELSDEKFLEIALPAIAAAAEPPDMLQNDVDVAHVLENIKGSIIDDLLKPPTKKP
jgi:hypothetical protein